MKIQRTIPPAASPLSMTDLAYGVYGMVNRQLIGKLERELREYFGTEYVFLVSSGKAALWLIFSGLKRLTGRNRVIIPAYTCFSVPSAVRMAGLETVLCDVRPETLDYDYTRLGGLIDEDTLCVVSTHLFGIPSDVAAIRERIGNRNVFIVEDAAQAMGGESGGRKLGTVGDVAFFSFGRGKNITCGSGGAIITSSADIADSIRTDHRELGSVPMAAYLRNIAEALFLMLFVRPNWYWLPKGLPFLKIGETRFFRTFPVRTFTGFQAGLLYRWREKLEAFNRIRARNADFYLDALGLPEGVPIYKRGRIYNRFPIFAGREEEKGKLCESGDRFGISPMYPTPVNEIEEIRDELRSSHVHHATGVSRTLVTLPTHGLLREADQQAICDVTGKVLPRGNTRRAIREWSHVPGR